MKTVIFYDSRAFEREFFDEKLQKNHKTVFIENSLNLERKLTAEEENAEIISVFTGSILTEDILKRFNSLKLILTRSVGFSHIDTDYCDKKGIMVANTPHYGDYTVAEFSFGLLLNLIRRICFAQNELKTGDFYPETFGIELFDKTIGIIGTGAIGEKSVKIATGFSLNVICYDVYENIEIERKYGAKYVDLSTLCKLSDFIMLHAPLNSVSYHLLDREKISLMKKNVVLVNTARGELVDTEALYEALLDGKIKGAALDVLEFEETISNKRPGENIDLKNLRTSLINVKLLNLQNVIVTPHIAYDTAEAVERIMLKTLQNLSEYETGKIPVNTVNKKDFRYKFRF